MNKKGWKATAIVFILLFVLVLSTFCLFIYGGSGYIDRENKCMVNVCGSGDFNSFFYDDGNKMCYCYKNSEIVYQEYIGG